MSTKGKPTGGIKNRGFGSMSKERLKELATQGGRTSQGKDPETGELKGNGYRWTRETSRNALAAKAKKRALKLTEEHNN